MWRMHIHKVWWEHRLVLLVGVLHQSPPPEREGGLVCYLRLVVSVVHPVRMMIPISRDSIPFMCINLGKYHIVLSLAELLCISALTFSGSTKVNVFLFQPCICLLLLYCLDIRVSIGKLAPVSAHPKSWHSQITLRYPCANHSQPLIITTVLQWVCWQGLLSYWVFSHRWSMLWQSGCVLQCVCRCVCVCMYCSRLFFKTFDQMCQYRHL